MAIDDNTSYELTGAQVKDLANKIKAKAADNIFVGATSAIPGSKGLVPAPQAGDDTKFLSGDGLWKTVSQYSLPIASSSTLGGIKVGNNLTIDPSTGVLDASGTTYTAGNGIDITNDTISIDDTVVAELSDIGNGTLTIKRNGTTDETFTANSSTNVTVDIQAPVRVDLRGQCQLGSWRRSVIALCRVPTAANQSVNSYSSGRLTFQRDNGIDGMFYIDFIIDAKYFTYPHWFNFSYSSNVPLLSSTDNIDTSKGFRPCVFKKDDIWYGGIEFAASNTNLAYVSFYGESNFEIFGVDYYSWAHTSGGTTIPSEVLDQEIYDSIDYTTVYWTNRQLSAKNITVEDGTIRSTQDSGGVYTATLPAKSGTVAMTSDLPTKTSDLTNDGADGTSTYVENDELSTATVGKANQLTTARTIGINGGAYSAGVSFNGTSNVNIPITDVKEAYVVWGNKVRQGGDLSPETMGCIDEFGHNRLAYLPAACVKVAFSRDGGTTWLDYTTANGANYTPADADKIKFTTYAQPSGFCAGGRTTNASTDPADEMVRVRVAAWRDTSTSTLYTDVKQLLVNMSTEGATGTKVQVRLRTIQNWIDNADTWTDKGTYDISGWSGWNSLPTIFRFGGSNSQKSQYGEIELIFSQTGVDSSTKKNMKVISLRAIGSNIWKSPSEMASTGRLYTIDYSQNATFPGEVVTNKIYPNADATYDLGASTKKWKNLYLSGSGKIYASSNALTLPSSAGTLALTSDIPSDFTGATSGAAGTNGLVPAPAAGDQDKVLSGAGTWVAQSSGTTYTAGNHIDITGNVISAEGYIWGDDAAPASTPASTITSAMIVDGTIQATDIATGVVPIITMTDTDPGEGVPLAANHFIAVYEP